MSASGEWVVLSPHLDDAVLSVGALIGRLAGSGERVSVWTAFTRGPAPQDVPRRLRTFADYPTRLAEDDRALDLLGAGRHRLDLPERIWRQPPVRGLRDAFRTPARAEDFGRLDDLVDVVTDLLARPGLRLLAPLGVGHHVDHVEVALAALTAAGRLDGWDRVGFYEDFYALGNAARRRHPVTCRALPSSTGRPAPGPDPAVGTPSATGPASHGGGRAGRLRALLEAPGWAAPVEGAVLRATPLIGTGPSLDRYLPQFAARDGRCALDWCCLPRPVDAASERLKLDAVAEYRSQTPALGGMHRLGPILRRAHRLRGGELIWSARPR